MGYRLMCQGCEDMLEYGAMIDTIIAKELPKIMARPFDRAVIEGPEWDAERRANLKALFS